MLVAPPRVITPLREYKKVTKLVARAIEAKTEILGEKIGTEPTTVLVIPNAKVNVLGGKTEFEFEKPLTCRVWSYPLGAFITCELEE